MADPTLSRPDPPQRLIVRLFPVNSPRYYVLLAANMLVVVPISVLLFITIDPGSPFGMMSRRPTQMIVSAVIAAGAIWTFAIGAWPAGRAIPDCLAPPR